MPNRSPILSVGEIMALRESNAIEGVYDDESLETAKSAYRWMLMHKRIGEHMILEAHKILMTDKLVGPELGQWRRCAVRVGSYYPPEFHQVPELMAEWIKDTGVKPLDYQQAYAMHMRFERIHPFVDGNGRIGRMLLLWQTRQQLGIPPVIIKEEDRENYYQSLR